MVPRLVRQVLSVAQAAVGTFGFAPAAKTAPLAVRAKVVRSMMTYRNPNDLLCLACSTPSAIGPDRCAQ